jgi:hypothetical protein
MSSFTCRNRHPALRRLLCNTTKSLFDRHLQDWTHRPSRRRPHKFPAHTVKDRLLGAGVSPGLPQRRFVRGSRTLYEAFEEGQHLVTPIASPFLPCRSAPNTGPHRRAAQSRETRSKRKAAVRAPRGAVHHSPAVSPLRSRFSTAETASSTTSVSSVAAMANE